MIANWEEVTALATALSGVALVVTAIFILAQLRRQSEEQFVSGTATTFAVWVDDDFQRAVQWVLYRLKEDTWRAFVAEHRGEYGERALIRVGGYFNRIGYLVTRRLLGGNDRLVLDTVAGSAIAVWRKIEPLVLEARLMENSTLFQDYQAMLPRCYECYVPSQPLPAPIRQGAAEASRLPEGDG